MNSSNNILNLEKTKQNLNLFRLLSEDYPQGSWQGRVILEIKKEGNAVFLQTSKITGWKAILFDKIKTFFGINQNSLPAVVEFIRKHQTALNNEAINIINSKIANHNAKKINKLFKRIISSLPTPQIISPKEVIEKTSVRTNVNCQEAAICLITCFEVIAESLIKGFPEVKAFLRRLEGKEDLEKAKAIREWIDSSPELLSKITKLSLSDLALTSLPPEIGQLRNLEALYLTKNQLTTLPVEIGQLQNLTQLYLSNNRLTSLPAEIGQLQELTNLSLINNQITSLPSEIGQLQNLTILNLHLNKLTSLPPEIGQLQNLTNLNLSHNQLTSLPEIGQLQKLDCLCLAHNKLSSLPAKIGQLQKLTHFELEYNPLTRLPDEIIKSRNSKIAQNGVVLKLEQMMKQNIKTAKEAAICLNKCFDVIAKTLAEKGHSEGQAFLKKLEGIEDLEKAKALKEWLKTYPVLLSKFTFLSLEGLKLTSLPAEIGQLQNLTHLYLGNNQLTNIPIEIGQLLKLNILNLGYNQLTAVPVEIGQLQNLTQLYLDNNRLKSLPVEIGKLQNLALLYLQGNPLTRVPDEIVNSSNPTIAQNKTVLTFSKKSKEL